MGEKSLKMKLRDKGNYPENCCKNTIYYYLVDEIVITVIAVKSGVLKHKNKTQGLLNIQC